MIDIELVRNPASHDIAFGTSHRFDGLPVFISDRCKDDQIIIMDRSRTEGILRGNGYVVMSPRTLIMVENRDPIEQLRKLLALNLKRALWRFDSKHFGLAMAA